MKKLFVILLITSTTFGIKINAQTAPKIKWITFKEAVENNNRGEKRKIITDVFTTWCGWCSRMDATTFANSEIAEYINKYFWAVKLDAEMKESVTIDTVTYINQRPNANRSTHDLAVKLLQNQMSYPSYVFLDENNKTLTIVPGYFNKENFMLVLRYFNENVYLTKPFAQFKAENAPTITPSTPK